MVDPLNIAYDFGKSFLSFLSEDKRKRKEMETIFALKSHELRSKDMPELRSSLIGGLSTSGLGMGTIEPKLSALEMGKQAQLKATQKLQEIKGGNTIMESIHDFLSFGAKTSYKSDRQEAFKKQDRLSKQYLS